MRLYKRTREVWPTKCDQCHKEVEYTRALEIGLTEFALCDKCLIRLAKLLLNRILPSKKQA